MAGKYWQSNAAWGGEESGSDIIVKTGTWIAIPSGYRYIGVILYYTQYPTLPTMGAFNPDNHAGHGVPVPFYSGDTATTADGVTVYIFGFGTGGSIEAVRPEEWADLTLQQGEDLGVWISQHTKAQIDNISKENQILVDLYINGRNDPKLTLHWETGNRNPIDAYVAWRPTSNTFYELNKTKGYYDLVSRFSGTGFCKENKYLSNEGGVAYTWGQLNNDTFNNIPKEERILLKGISTNYNTADYYNLIVQFGLTTDNEGVPLYKVSKRILCEIPARTPETASSIKYDIRFNSEEQELELPITFTVHIDEDIPIDTEDDIINNDDSDDNPDNNGNKNNADDKNYQDGNGANTTGLLTTTYAMTAEQTKALGRVLWTQDYFNILKVQTNPIENIVSCKAFPLSLSGTTSDIVIGNINTNVQGAKVSNNTKVVTIFTNKSIPVVHKNYLDYAPFTEISIYLPFVGIKQLDVGLIMGTSHLNCDLIVDLLTGAGRYRIKRGTSIIAEFDCTIGIDIPLTSSDRAQADAKHLASIGMGIFTGATAGAVGAIAGGVSGVINGIADGYHMSQTSGGSPTVSSSDVKDVFLIINRPTALNSGQYTHTHGRPCRKSYQIKDLEGYTEIDRIDLTGLSLTTDEENELREILTSGFYA